MEMEPEPVETMPVVLNRLRAGHPSEAERLFARYAERLTRVAERHLNQKLAGRLDGEDVVQSVFRTFFRRVAAGEYQIDTSARLWHLLVQITVRKAAAKARGLSAGVQAERPNEARLLEALSHEPGPTEAVALVDQIEDLLHGLPSVYGRILDLRLQGCGVTEVAGRVGVSRQTIHRALNLLQQRLAEAERRLD